jgi:Leucine-rich repeat (LRR) protein
MSALIPIPTSPNGFATTIADPPDTPQNILKTLEAFDGILDFPALDKSRVSQDPAYAHNCYSEIERKVTSVYEFQELLKIRKHDFIETAKAIKNLDLIEAIRKISPQIFPERHWKQFEEDLMVSGNIISLSDYVRRFLQVNEQWLQQISEVSLSSLSHVHLTSIPLELFRYFPNLKRLVLPNTQIRAIPKEIASLSRLYFLALPGNQIENIPDTLVPFFSRLSFIDIQNNPIRHFPAELKPLIGNKVFL